MVMEKESVKSTSEFQPLALNPDLQTTPQGWRWHKLIDLARLESGHTPSRRQLAWWGGDIPWLSLSDIRALDGKIALKSLEYTNEVGIKNSSARVLPTGTVVLSRTASVGFVTVLGVPMATSQDFANWICGPELDSLFLAWLLRNSRKYVLSLASGAVHQTVYMPAIREFHVCLPSIETQRYIAAKLDAQMKAVETAQMAVIEQLEIARGLTNEFLREIFESEDANTWATQSIESLGEQSRGEIVQTGPFGAQLSSHDFTHEGVRVLNVGNVQFGQLDTSRVDFVTPEKAALLEKYRIEPGDLLFTRSGSVGRCAVATKHVAGSIMSTHLLRVGFNPEKMNPEFAVAAIQGCRSVLDQIRLAAKRGSTREGVNTSVLKNLVIPVPALEAQHQIVIEVTRKREATKSLINTLEVQLETINAMPAALLREAFSGKL